MPQFIYRPAEKWTDPLAKARRHSDFKSTLISTRNLLEYELEKLKAKNAVVAVMAREFLRDGKPRQESVFHPGVVLTFDSINGPLRIAASQFWDWRDNLRGIALGLEALRKIDRYGISQSAEQYRGYGPLSIAEPILVSSSDARDFAIEYIAIHSGQTHSKLVADKELLRRSYKVAAGKLHPDAGGDAADFRRLQHAKELLQI